MVIVDAALERREKEGHPVRVGIVGAGYMGRGIATQLVKPLPGIRLAAVANRTVSKAEQALRDSGLQHFHRAATVGQIEMAISAGKVAVTDDPLLLEPAGVATSVYGDTVAVGDGDEIDLTPKPGAEEPFIPPVEEE